MFAGCESLTSTYLYNFETDSLKEMDYMFKGCSSLTSIDLSNFNTKITEKMTGVFVDCPSLQYIEISSFICPIDKIIYLSDFQAISGMLFINEAFYSKLQVKPNNNWAILYNKAHLLE